MSQRRIGKHQSVSIYTAACICEYNVDTYVRTAKAIGTVGIAMAQAQYMLCACTVYAYGQEYLNALLVQLKFKKAYSIHLNVCV